MSNLHKPILIDGNDHDFPIEVTEMPAFSTREINEDGYDGLGRKTKMRSVIRSDTGELLSCVSDKYALITHGKVTGFVEDNLRKAGIATDRRIIMSHRGARMYAEYNTRGHQVEVEKDDVVGMQLIVRNSYDTSGSLAIVLHSVRLVCTNGMTAPGERMFNHSKRHVGEIEFNDKLEKQLLNSVSSYNDIYIPFFKGLIKKPLTKMEGRDIIDEVCGCGILPEYKKEHFTIEWNKGEKPNAWNLFNLFTYYLTHEIKKQNYHRYLSASKKISTFFARKLQ